MIEYTQIFKVHRIEIESPSIQLSDSSWIESSNDYAGIPENFSPSICRFFEVNDDPQFSLINFYKQLIASPVRLRTVHTGEQSDKNPFVLHDCSHIAIALSIICDSSFICGIEFFSNSNNPENPSLGRYTNFFQGHNSVASITCADEGSLLVAYDFVYQTLAAKSWISEDGKLLCLFLKCIVRPPNQRFGILKIGLDHLFTEWDATILNAALFFEHLLTNESSNRDKGIEVWNKVFGEKSFIDKDIVDVIFNLRHTVAHANPIRAQKKINDWKGDLQVDNNTIVEKLREDIWRTAKSCIRARVFDPERFKYFMSLRPS